MDSILSSSQLFLPLLSICVCPLLASLKLQIVSTFWIVAKAILDTIPGIIHRGVFLRPLHAYSLIPRISRLAKVFSTFCIAVEEVNFEQNSWAINNCTSNLLLRAWKVHLGCKLLIKQVVV